MKVLHINTEPTWRGGEQQALYLMSGLLRLGVGTVLACQPGSPMEERARQEGIDVLPVRMGGEGDPLSIGRLAAGIRRLRPDIVHYHTSHAHGLGAAATLLAGRPRTVVTRRVEFSIYRHSFLGLNGLKYRFGVDRIIAISERIRRVLVEDGLAVDRIDVVHSGIDPARFEGVSPLDLHREFGIPRGHRVVGNIANFDRVKGQQDIIDAAPHVLREAPDTTFLLVGEGRNLDPLVERARELGISDRTRFPGFRRDVPAILRALDLFVMSSRQEGLGTAVLDALACGLPVVATRAGGIPEIVEDGRNGLLVPPGEPEALSRALLRLLMDGELAHRLAAAGPETVRARFTVDRMVAGNLAVYERLLTQA